MTTLTFSNSGEGSIFNDGTSPLYPRETERAFSSNPITNSLNTPEVLNLSSRPDVGEKAPDLGVGKHLREAVAIVKDWAS